ncbi:hypothetical protein KP509_03G031800 [Ceratopteris richardii]|nr:hypothetical protein KP509_03G031800 [Ceratopteris richardii]
MDVSEGNWLPCSTHKDLNGRKSQERDGVLIAVSATKKKKIRRSDGIHSNKRMREKASLATVGILNNDARVAINFVALLKLCTKEGDLQRGIDLHKQINELGLARTNVFVGSSLVTLYARCGAMQKAQEVFDMLSNPNVVSWNALLTGYINNGYAKKALNLFEQMQQKGIVADAVSFTCAMKACSIVKDLEKGQEIHTKIMRERFLERDVVVANAVVDMYAKCGALQKAREVFDQLPTQDTVSWTALISGYVQQGKGQEALHCYEQMRQKGVQPDNITYTSILKACGSVRAFDKGEEIYNQVRKEHRLDTDVVIMNALVDMYIKCGALDRAQEVFSESRVHNIISWNALISGYAQYGQGLEALNCYEEMKKKGFSPDAVTFATLLKACGTIEALEWGRELHKEVAEKHLVERDVVVAGALIDMYAKCGDLDRAREVFNEVPVRDVVTWTSLISGFVENGLLEKALVCYEQMKLDGLSPNAITYACILKACASDKALYKGEVIHTEIINRQDGLEDDTVVGTALVDMYSKCGAMEKAQAVFDRLSMLDVASWNALILGYSEQGLGNEALKYFHQMQHEGFHPDVNTFICLVRACGYMGTVHMGMKLHALLLKLGLVDEVELIGSFLLVMYSNCGMLLEAEEVFHTLPTHDVVSWSVLMEGYAQIGKENNVLSLLKQMKGKGLAPTSVTLTVILNACNHRGLLEVGQNSFEMISKDHGILPTLEHYSCMVDLFSRAGHLDTAVTLIERMPFPADLAMWHALLGACRNSSNKVIGKLAFKNAFHLNENNDAAYISIGEIYAASADRISQTH